ncbi:MAG: hypothetical protein U9R75_06140, partial [Candidatus Thermoplasmatota archaeon]|nr:hypothetical protein [Candidatus Thermoplasmatota archaeon]
MKRKEAVPIIMVMMFLLGGAYLTGASDDVYGAPTTWTVDKGGSGTHTTISGAVASASDGDTILIHDGIFNEQVSIMKNGLTIIGNGVSNTVISPGTNNNGFS